mmetsp:Transcript_16630/g.62998  ORF Transcript_16630/g.62998 Transcript_16630/m.62998 type:complete len:262 (+) Transcript_16630:497-1282(+)
MRKKSASRAVLFTMRDQEALSEPGEAKGLPAAPLADSAAGAAAAAAVDAHEVAAGGGGVAAPAAAEAPPDPVEDAVSWRMAEASVKPGVAASRRLEEMTPSVMARMVSADAASSLSRRISSAWMRLSSDRIAGMCEDTTSSRAARRRLSRCLNLEKSNVAATSRKRAMSGKSPLGSRWAFITSKNSCGMFATSFSWVFLWPHSEGIFCLRCEMMRAWTRARRARFTISFTLRVAELPGSAIRSRSRSDCSRRNITSNSRFL